MVADKTTKSLLLTLGDWSHTLSKAVGYFDAHVEATADPRLFQTTSLDPVVDEQLNLAD